MIQRLRLNVGYYRHNYCLNIAYNVAKVLLSNLCSHNSSMY